MAATKDIYDVKLQVRVENGSTSSGANAFKNINFSQIKLTATGDELLAAGQAISNLQSNALSEIRVIDSYTLTTGD
ncbi:MAG TPA: hypothetical protein DDY92_00125 [Dialister sp.]|nr:hypothetical protein [Dialister sp.]